MAGLKNAASSSLHHFSSARPKSPTRSIRRKGRRKITGSSPTTGAVRSGNWLSKVVGSQYVQLTSKSKGEPGLERSSRPSRLMAKITKPLIIC